MEMREKTINKNKLNECKKYIRVACCFWHFEFSAFLVLSPQLKKLLALDFNFWLAFEL